MKCLLFLLLLSGLGCFAYYQGWLEVSVNYPPEFSSPTAEAPVEVNPRPLDELTFDNLRKRQYESSPIVLERVIKQDKKFTSYLFTYKSDGEKVSGMATIPVPQADEDKLPTIVMIRGFVDQDIYQTGVGTWRAAEVLAENGFVTLAPDFLGYGESDKPEDDVFWERLNRPVQILNLMASLNTLAQVDTERVGLWGHSNGGQIALSILEISQKPYPTVLWAPVSKPFPYAILYYTDEFDDQGLKLRYELANFEKLYDVNKYSISEYFDRIMAPIQLHQGTIDDAVPLEWSNELADKLKASDVEVNYYVYPQADHNLSGSWDTVVQRDVGFYKRMLKKENNNVE